MNGEWLTGEYLSGERLIGEGWFLLSGGGFGFGTGVEKSFNVTIGEKIIPPPAVEKEISNKTLYIIFGIILAIVLIVYFMKKKKIKK